MKPCPDEDQLAAIVLRGKKAPGFTALTKHVAKCPACHRTMAQFEKLRLLLPHVALTATGSVTVKPAMPTRAFVEQLKHMAIAQLKASKKLKEHLLRLVENLFNAVGDPETTFGVEPALVGYASTAPPKPKKARDNLAARQRLQKELAAILEVLLNRNLPVACRASWAASVSKLLQTRAAKSRRGSVSE